MPARIPVHVPPHKRTAAYAATLRADPRLMTNTWKVTRRAVLVRDMYTCQYCGKELHGLDATVDHVVARADGGAMHDMANLKAACRACNSKKGRRVAP